VSWDPLSRSSKGGGEKGKFQFQKVRTSELRVNAKTMPAAELKKKGIKEKKGGGPYGMDI